LPDRAGPMTWRTGTKNPHTLYLDEGDVSLPQGFIMNPGAARAIVEAMNAAEPVVDDPVWLRNEVRRLRGVMKETVDRAQAERVVVHKRGCVCVLCEAEQAVLDACRGMPAEALEATVSDPSITPNWYLSLARAELARRKLAP
jgi:hypothetical protein